MINFVEEESTVDEETEVLCSKDRPAL